jgi:hypothetical protein
MQIAGRLTEVYTNTLKGLVTFKVKRTVTLSLGSVIDRLAELTGQVFGVLEKN